MQVFLFDRGSAALLHGWSAPCPVSIQFRFYSFRAAVSGVGMSAAEGLGSSCRGFGGFLRI